MNELDLRQYKMKHLQELWDAVPAGYRLRMAVYTDAPIVYGPPLTEARMLAYCGRVVLKVKQKGRDIYCVVSPKDDPAVCKPYRVPCWG